MSVLSRKRRIKCAIQELLSVPFINGVLFCKIRLLDGGHFVAYSSKKEIHNSSVIWNFDINFEVKLYLNILNSALFEPCMCRISVRKELRGGKSYQKLGYIDYNLSDYLNKSETINRVLKEYDSKNRLDNSYLKIKVNVNEINANTSKRPTTLPISHQQPINNQQQLQQIEHEKTPPSSETASPQSENCKQIKHGFYSPSKTKIKTENLQSNGIGERSFTPTHSRNSSKGSALSFAERGHQRNISNSSTTSNNSYETVVRTKATKFLEDIQSKETNSRIIETRIDANEIINQIENELTNRANSFMEHCSLPTSSTASSLVSSYVNQNKNGFYLASSQCLFAKEQNQEITATNIAPSIIDSCTVKKTNNIDIELT